MRLCSRCKKNPAVIFVSRIEGDKTTQEGLCIKCAMELNIGPIKDMLSKMGITDEDIDALNENFTESLGDGTEGFENGGASTLPFLQNLFGGLGASKSSADDGDVDLPAEAVDGSAPKKETEPASFRARPRRERRVVVLPAPFLPTKPTISPSPIEKERGPREKEG